MRPKEKISSPGVMSVSSFTQIPLSWYTTQPRSSELSAVMVGESLLQAIPLGPGLMLMIVGIKDIFANPLVIGCALVACIGGFLFGFDQGLLSIVLVMPRFQSDFPDIDDAQSSSAGWNRGYVLASLTCRAAHSLTYLQHHDCFITIGCFRWRCSVWFLCRPILSKGFYWCVHLSRMRC